MTRAPKDAELLATGKILALFATLTEGGRRRVRERLGELYGPYLSFDTASPSAQGPPPRNLPPTASGTPLPVPAGGHLPGWDQTFAPPSGGSPGA